MRDRENLSLKRLLQQRLESLESAGVQQLSKPAASVIPLPLPVETPGPVRLETPPRPIAPLSTPSSEPASLASDAPSLEVLRQEVAACTLCGELAATRTQTVFGVGSPNAQLCFLGEAPGADEDRLGEPFVGRAGHLLNKIIEACQMTREEVYIMNVLRCRPPNNRNPSPQEASNCRRFLDRQLELIAPEFICCLGSIAAQNLLATPVSIGRLRGKIHDYQGIKVVCTYHPAYLLRTPSAKKDTWEDMKLLLREMGRPID